MSLFDRIRQVVGQQSSEIMSPSSAQRATSQGEEDAWSDTSSSDGDANSTRTNESPSQDARLDTHESLEEDMAKYLPYMPALLGPDLPPCGLPIQVAYENLNTRLRTAWLYSRGQKSLTDLCQVVKDDLVKQTARRPPFDRTPGSFGRVVQRMPWRHEAVFFYEIRWIDYFLREAKAADRAAESGVEGVEDGDEKPQVAGLPGPSVKQRVIPNELGLQCNREDVSKLWVAWHAKKHARTPPVPSAGAESHLEPGADGVVKVANGGHATVGVSGEAIIKDPAQDNEGDMEAKVRARSSCPSPEAHA